MTPGSYAPVVICGSNSTCTVQVNQALAGTHRYLAFVSAYGTAYLSPNIQATSAMSFITWSNAAFSVSLSAPAWTYGNETVMATTNRNVGSSVYYVQIFDETTGTLLTQCPGGTSCSVEFSPSCSGDDLVAFVARFTTLFPPTTITASSNVAHTFVFLH